MQIIPAIDVLDGRVVRLLRGDYGQVTEYSADPAGVALAWASQGAELVHVVDLAGARSGAPDRRIWEAIAATAVPFQVGGGLRTVADASAALESGAVRVVLGSAAVWEPGVLADLVARYGPERIVAAVDVRSGRAKGSGWTDGGKDLETVLAGAVGAGCRWVLATGIARDGTLEGPDLGLVAEIRKAAPIVSVIGSGGVGELADLVALARTGAAAVVVGRALYDGRFSLAEARAALTAGDA